MTTIRHMGKGAFLVSGIPHTVSEQRVRWMLERAIRSENPQREGTDSRRYERFIALKLSATMNGFYHRSAIVTIK